MEGIEELVKQYQSVSDEIEKVELLLVLIRESAQQFPENIDSHKAYLTELKELVTRNKYKIGTAHVHYCEGLLSFLDDREKALSEYNEALKIYRELQEYQGLAQTLLKIGVIFMLIKEYDKAEDYYNEALKIARQINDRIIQGRVLCFLGVVYTDKKKLEKAQSCFVEAIEMAKGTGDKYALKRAYGHLSAMYISSGEFDKAKDTSLTAVKLFRTDKDLRFYGRLLNNIGMVYVSTWEYEKALRYLNKSIKIKTEISDEPASSYVNIGVVYMRLKKYDSSLMHLKKALKLSLSINDTVTIAECYTEMAACYALMKNYRNAFNCQLNAGKYKELTGIIKDSPVFIEVNSSLKEASKEIGLVQIVKKPSREGDIYRKLYEKSNGHKFPNGIQDLTKREMETLSFLALGINNKQVSEKMFVSVTTVKTHLRSVFVKLNVKNRAELVALVHRSGLFE